MFANFYKAFIEKPQFQGGVPQAVIDAISKDLPGNLYYVEDKDGVCGISSPEGIHISGVIRAPSEASGVLTNDNTLADVLQYAYNAQKQLQIMPNKSGKFIINGHEVDPDKMLISPMRNIKIDGEQLFILPNRFPDPIELSFSGDGRHIKLLVERVANNSINVKKYKTQKDHAFQVVFTVEHLEDRDIIMPTFTISRKSAKNAQEYLDALYLFNSFLSGSGFIEDMPILVDNHKYDSQLVDEDILMFWNHVYALEQALHASFDMTKEIDPEDIQIIQQLYVSIVNNNAFRESRIFSNLTGKGSDLQQRIEAAIQEKQPIGIEFVEEYAFSLLGHEISIFSDIGIFNAVPVELVFTKPEEPDSFSVRLGAVEGMKLYCGAKLFLNMDDVEKFRKKPDHLKELAEAEEI